MSMSILLLSAALLLTGCQSNTVTNTASSIGDTLVVADARFLARSLRLEARAVAAGDFDGDEHSDLVGARESQLTVFLGDGDGALESTSHVAGGETPVDFAVADLDADGAVDIAVANHETDYITLLLGDGTGAFQPAPNSPLRIAVQPHPHAVRAADLDADGAVDLLVDHREAEGVLILGGLGGGQFESPGTVVEVGGDPYRGMALGDLNGDGKLDLVTPNPREVGVLLNVSSDRIAFTQAAPVAAAAPFAVELGDFNGDDQLDLIVASDEGSSLIELFFGDGQGGFEEASASPFRLAPGGKNIAVGDFNGDGFDDAAVSSYQAADVLMLLGGRDSIRTGYLPGGEHPWHLAVADFNEDEKDDLVISDDADGSAAVYVSLDP